MAELREQNLIHDAVAKKAVAANVAGKGKQNPPVAGRSGSESGVWQPEKPLPPPLHLESPWSDHDMIKDGLYPRVIGIGE